MISFYINWASSTLFGLLHGNKFNPSWNAALNRLIDNHHLDARVGDGGFTVDLGGHEVWIENRFYAFGYSYTSERDRQFRPSVKTMCRLWLLVAPMVAEIERKKNDFSDLG